MYESDAKPEQGSILASLEQQLGLDQEQDTACWPENWSAVMLFADLSTQWNVGMNGPIGLRYEAIPAVLHARKQRATPELFNQLRTLERGALEAMRNG